MYEEMICDVNHFIHIEHINLSIALTLIYTNLEYDDITYILYTLTLYFKTYPIYMPVMFMRIVLNKQVIRMRCLLYLSSVHVCD